MKLNPPKNQNYAATVVRVKSIIPLSNCDNVVAIPVLGCQAIVGKDTKVGDLGVVFTAETQLSDVFACANSLYRHSEKNWGESKKGYLEDNRRIKAVRFRGHRSDALFMPLSSLAHFTNEWDQLKEGDTFDEINGQEICRKYEIPRTGRKSFTAGKQAGKSLIDDCYLPKHFDTPNYFRVPDAIGPDDFVVATQKLHGTSIRVGHTVVKRQKLNWIEKLAKKFGVKVPETEYKYVYGSRNVIKDPNAGSDGFYGTDIYTEVGRRLEGLLPKGYVVYGEIIGWVPGTSTPIQAGYTYQLPEGEAELYVYRVAVINEDGRTVDLSWSAVKEFCTSIGVKCVPEITSFWGAPGEEVNDWLDVRYADFSGNAVPTEESQVDEGCCLRVEGMTPTIVKAKSPIFLGHETKMLDKGEIDIESSEEVTA